jgi:hypothetical protein
MMRKAFKVRLPRALATTPCPASRTTSIRAGQAVRTSCNKTTIKHNKSGIELIEVAYCLLALFPLGLFFQTRNQHDAPLLPVDAPKRK